MEGRIQCDYCVVGAGMIGSAAAKHLQVLNPSSRVVLVGPSEPKSRKDADIFGAYYDEGRMARELDPDPVWDVLYREGIAAYDEISKQSGYRFYNRCGWMYFSKDEKDDLVDMYNKRAKKSEETVTYLNAKDMKVRYPYLTVPPGTVGILFPSQGGHINPRVLHKAQQKIAKNHGCQIMDDVVDSIHEESSGHHVLHTDSGKQISAKKVLLATGAFTECRNLLPKGFSPAMDSTTETVLFVEVSDDVLRNLRNMPCMASTIKIASGNLGYMLPPIMYPNGRHYLKIGHFRDYNLPLCPNEIASWFQGDFHPVRERTKKHLMKAFAETFPEVPMVNYYFDYCSTVPTKTNYPYIDMLNSSFGVAIGGCGSAAKCSDEIGKIAARMLTKGSWDYELLASENFKLKNRLQARL